MTWIETPSPSPARPELLAALEVALGRYPSEYTPARQAEMRVPPEVRRDSIVRSHALAPAVMQHVFAAYAEMLSADLPLSRRQQEMIATVVSKLNQCHY